MSSPGTGLRQSSGIKVCMISTTPAADLILFHGKGGCTVRLSGLRSSFDRGFIGEQYTIGVSGVLLIKQVRSKIKLPQARELRPPSLFMNQAIGISFNSLESII